MLSGPVFIEWYFQLCINEYTYTSNDVEASGLWPIFFVIMGMVFTPLPKKPVGYCDHQRLSVCPSTLSVNTISYQLIAGESDMLPNNAPW